MSTERRSLPDADDVSVSDAVRGDLLDFHAAMGSTSWIRADGLHALIERASTYGWRVTLPDGEDAHAVALADQGCGYVGWCDCQGFEYNNGPCAHLCTIRKAAFIDGRTTTGERVRIASTAVEDSAAPGEALPDGGYHVERAQREHALGDRRVGGEGPR